MDVAVTSSSPLFFSYRTPALSSSSSSISLPKAALAHNHRHVQTNAIRPKRTSLPAAISSSPISTATMVRVESFDAGEPVELDILDGTWRLQYTSAPDVLILFQSAETLPFLQVGQIFQKFECKDKNGQGIVRNVVRWSIPNFLEEHEGATLLVSAKFSVVSKRNIYLEFEEITIQNIQISEELQALIAPALLPRTFLSLQILQFIKTFRFQVPVNSPQRRSAGGLYYLSYLDSNMLLGRAVGGGGVFVFTRAHASI
ncbi:probable plastid-lipid-associated protein 10, chloroplastic isoform X2 [Olea europaea var. sylvestris]|uniref:probable plastid-lipid-associated protein 10, chloroplastic isoform X2 n=1 Tax=Olea europaea var. sylvestris TaxID=158386 RepID=UPI000C1D4E9D|nr:probable plastid-lipid-associated protein 10, chloroplastic isoform X2 [Olea europaea var. sylvestris]